MRKQLHVISDGQLLIDEFVELAKRLEPYVDKFHVREKQKSAKEIYKAVQCMITRGIPLSKIIINDRIDVALALQTGAQLAYHSLPIGIVKKQFPNLQAGRSIHSYDEAVEAEENGADYLLYGHVFSTSSKPSLQPRGLEELAKIKKTVKLPVFAIGGITPENLPEVLETNIDGIAIMSGIIKANDPLQEAKRYVSILHKGGEY